jgi:hypothetical protein
MFNRKIFFGSIVLLSALVAPPAESQGMTMPGMPGMKDSTFAKKDSSATRPMTADDMMIGPLGISMDRMGSGTTWIPDAVAMPSRRTMVGSWMLMGHGFAFAQYDHQSGKRGDDQLGSLNWAMLMATKELAGGRFQARTMLSLDALTVTKRGYPLLLQTGETLNGVPIHDRQHPHDFWMELGALYQRAATKTLGWSIYAAPSGEPALGPVAFMHRPSAMDNLPAPVGHHWQDATHIAFGVLTAALFAKEWQLEASTFNGREPDENRWNFDSIRLDSYSARATFNPDSGWSLSAGYGYLKQPDASAPGMSMHRITASVQNGKRLGADGQWASALIWGANKETGDHSHTQSVLAESEAVLDRRNTLFARAEFVEKNAHDLDILPATDHRRFKVGTAELGYVREISSGRYATLGLGAAGTLNFVPLALAPYYGTRTPVGLFVFLRVRPIHSARAPADDMHGMPMEH